MYVAVAELLPSPLYTGGGGGGGEGRETERVQDNWHAHACEFPKMNVDCHI